MGHQQCVAFPRILPIPSCRYPLPPGEWIRCNSTLLFSFFHFLFVLEAWVALHGRNGILKDKCDANNSAAASCESTNLWFGITILMTCMVEFCGRALRSAFVFLPPSPRNCNPGGCARFENLLAKYENDHFTSTNRWCAACLKFMLQIW